MKVVILAGGLGTRLSEETLLKPKPMIEIGDKPILWHIMKIYSNYGINDFIVCCGYKSYVIKEYFKNYFHHQSDIIIDLKKNNIQINNKNIDPWKITLADTGQDTMTGGRLKRIKKYLTNNETFCFTFGEGVGYINFSNLIKFHKKHGKKATITASRPPGRYGAIKFKNNSLVDKFVEKPDGDNSWINGGFFVLNESVLNLIENDKSVWETDVLPKLAKSKQLYAFKHYGFWQPMDTLREKKLLNDLWDKNVAPWKIWQ